MMFRFPSAIVHRRISDSSSVIKVMESYGSQENSNWMFLVVEIFSLRITFVKCYCVIFIAKKMKVIKEVLPFDIV